MTPFDDSASAFACARRSSVVVWCSCLAILVLTSGALASGGAVDPAREPPTSAAPSSKRISLFADIFGRANPQGVMAFFGGSYRVHHDFGTTPLFRDLYTQGGASIGANPAYLQWTISLETVPIAFLQLRIQYDGYSFFGANGALLSFPSRDAPFGDTDRSTLAGTEVTGVAHRGLVAPVFRAKIGPVVLRNQTDIAYYHLANRSGHYLEWEYDTLVESTGLLISDRIAAMLQVWSSSKEQMLLIGPFYEWTRSMSTNIIRQRVGAALWWVPVERWAGFDRPRLFSMTGINVVDRNREGEPFLVLGVGTDWDLQVTGKPVSRRTQTHVARME